MSLEALCQSKSLDKVESNALEIYKQENDPLEKRVLEELLQREAKFKETVPSLISTIAIESTEAQMTSVLLKRLDHRKGQLTCFKEEVYRLEEEELKLEAEIQQLSARKAKIVEHKNATAIDPAKGKQDASTELDN
ncbi:hypothetical protein LINPERPRIM_LOCUS38194 [Linum perenne]